jgi:eukaryotic translation initiation factor 2-alpha kinase 4
VYKARNRLDNIIYAVKKVKLEDNSQKENDRILREVSLLSRLKNDFIVRYYQAWIEDGNDDKDSSDSDELIMEEDGSQEGESSVFQTETQKEVHSASSYDISRAVPAGRPKYFDNNYLNSDSESSSIVFEKGDTMTIDKVENYSDKSQTVTNEHKLLKRKKSVK